MEKFALSSRRHFVLRTLTLSTLPALTACGFRMRGDYIFAFKTLYSGFVPQSSLGRLFEDTIKSGNKVRVLAAPESAETADVVLVVNSENRERTALSTNSNGSVRELQLRIRLNFKLVTPAGKELIADNEIVQQRDLTYNESTALAKENEEALLFEDIQKDIVQQLLRRLAAVKSL